jgi:Fe-S-cluster-containing hydrogenase component 2
MEIFCFLLVTVIAISRNAQTPAQAEQLLTKKDKEHKKMIKYDFCRGKEILACVANYPTEALFRVEYDGRKLK